MTILDTNILQTYVHIVEEGSFSAAARRMGISRSQASKYVSDLEKVLGTRLLTRSTRSVRTTSLGEQYYARVRSVLSDLRCANEDIRLASRKVTGLLRIGGPAVCMSRILQPMMMRFMEDYPEVQLELVLNEGRIDLRQEGLDAAIVGGELADSTLYAKTLQVTNGVMVAAPSYLAEAGVPQVAAALLDHRCLHHSQISTAQTWPLLKGGEVSHQRINAALMVNNWELLYAAALEGQGIAIVPEHLIGEDLAEGRLIRVLPDYEKLPVPLSLVYADSRNQATGALRAFLNFADSWSFEQGTPAGKA